MFMVNDAANILVISNVVRLHNLFVSYDGHHVRLGVCLFLSLCVPLEHASLSLGRLWGVQDASSTTIAFPLQYLPPQCLVDRATLFPLLLNLVAMTFRHYWLGTGMWEFSLFLPLSHVCAHTNCKLPICVNCEVFCCLTHRGSKTCFVFCQKIIYYFTIHKT